MWRWCWIALFVGLIGSGSAGAADLRAATGIALQYDDNVFGVSENSTRPKRDDLQIVVHPRLDLIEDEGEFRYEFGYRAPIERGFFENQDARIDQVFRGALRYHAAESTWLHATGSVRFLQNPTKETEELQVGGQDPILEVSTHDNEVLRTVGSFGATHSFTPRLQGRTSASVSSFSTTAQDRADAITFGANASMSYTLTPKMQLGGGLNAHRQEFEDLPGQKGPKTNFFNFIASLNYRFDETMAFEIRGGPTYIVSEQGSPNDNIPIDNPFVFEPVDTSTNVQAAFDFSGDGMVDTISTIAVPPGSLIVGDGSQCATLVDATGTQVIAPLPNCFDAVLIAGVHQDAIDAITSESPAVLQFDDLAFPFPGSTTTRRWTFFGDASFIKRWTPTVQTRLTYLRRESTASGLGGSSILDQVSATTWWRASPLWTLSLRADWNRRESVGNTTQTLVEIVPFTNQNYLDQFAFLGMPAGVPFLVQRSGTLLGFKSRNVIDTQRWGVSSRIARKMSPNLSLVLRLFYNVQESKTGTAGSTSDFKNFLGLFGVDYRFDPVRLW